MKNYSDTISNKDKKQLSAKAYKFTHKCIDIALNKKGINRYSLEAKPIKEKLREIFDQLFFEQEMTIEQVKEVIKNRIEKNTLTP